MDSTVTTSMNARLRRLLEVGRVLVSELDPEAVLHQVLEVARELTGARYAALGILESRRDRARALHHLRRG